jgi:glycine/D-amino acid oxidase-like deaminating enzyme/nitrite reductase/ring-hydroxylating ferredoxin subunit
MSSFDQTAHPGGQTQSLWQATFTVPDFPALDRDVETDICVVGAGISGLSTAYMLAKAGKHVVVVDDGPIGGGETGRTTAHLSNAMDDRIYRLEKIHGEDTARLVVESHTAAINRIDMIVTEEKIDCDFGRRDGYLFAETAGATDDLERELAAAHRAGLTDVRLVERAPISAFDTGAALRFPEQAQLHALKYLAGLARAIELMGGDIFCGSHVTEIEGGKKCSVKIEAGHTIKAKAVCVCTNASISDYVQTHAKQAPYRTYAIGLPAPSGSAEPALFWDTGDPYHYVRVHSLPTTAVDGPDGAVRDVLIVGGEDHKTAHEDDAESRWAALEEWARQRWPQVGPVMYRWSGQVLEPSDGLAFIGRNPDGAENVYMVSGDSGQGMTHGTIAGMILTDLIMGRENPWAAIYDPKRLTLALAPVEEMIKENVDNAVAYVRDYLRPGESEAEIAVGEGRVIRRGLQKVAAYRDNTGSMHYCSAVCTHLKCVVGWNSIEKSWDCPCHGSRFDPMGRVINGPALNDLERISLEPKPASPARYSREKRGSEAES